MRGPAALQLREKAERMLQRQREKRQHEKNLRQGKHKPWAPPPAPAQTRQEDSRPPKHKAPHSPKPPKPGRTAPDFTPGRGSARSDRSFKAGPGGRKLSGKFRHKP